MERSTERLLTTHTGSLPRPAGLQEAIDEDRDAALAQAVSEVVAAQARAGIDVVSDGEASKPSYATYIVERTSGFGGEGRGIGFEHSDVVEFPDWGAPLLAGLEARVAAPVCIAEVQRTDSESVRRDAANLMSAVEGSGAREGFLTAASPGVITTFIENQHYASHEEFVTALVEVMKPEYDTIYESGLVLQIDCPDLAGGRHIRYPGLDLASWKKIAELHVEALNAATRDIPPEAMRMHLCWGNYDGPHNHDVPLHELLPIVLRARPSALSFEAANPRHEHEWQLWDEVDLPDDKVLIPGVIDSTTNYVEHPELIAERLLRFARAVGRERVIGGSDCGFATHGKSPNVFPSVAYAKLGALAQGAQLASAKLW